MASEENSAHRDKSPAPAREPLSPLKQKRLQQMFEHAGKQIKQKNYDYATELLTECVLGDPLNLSYVESFVDNLHEKYGNNRKGSKLAQFKERGARGALKKAKASGKWDEVIKNALKVLKVNPWDVVTLTSLATATSKMGSGECELYHLKRALEANINDPDVNWQCAAALRLRGLFDQAIACLHRVALARPDDEEVQRAIASMTVEKTVALGGYDDDDDDDDDKAKRPRGKRAGPGQEEEQELTAEGKLRQKIAADPEEIVNYFELAQLYINSEEYERAETVLADAYEASDGDHDVRERWEDVQLRQLRKQVALAEKRGDEEGRKKFRNELITKEVAVYQDRCRRYPGNTGFKYELGLRYQLAGKFNEAIEQFQLARNDPQRKGRCLLRLGQCFQQIKQNGLAMSHYESAIEEIPDRDAENKKRALYLAGKMAVALKNLDSGEKHLTQLAELDFGYEDVSKLLEKITAIRKNSG